MGDIPFQRIADAVWVHQVRSGDVGDVAQAAACQVPDQPQGSILVQDARLLFQEAAFLVAVDRILFGKIRLAVQMGFIHWSLRYDVVEVKTALGQLSGRRSRRIAIRMQVKVPFGILRGDKTLADHHFGAIEQAPGLPTLVPVSEHRGGRPHPDHIDPQRR